MSPSVIVAPHFRSMEEIFRPAALDRLGSFAELVWGVGGPMPQDMVVADLEAIITNKGERRMQYLTSESLESLMQPSRE